MVMACSGHQFSLCRWFTYRTIFLPTMSALLNSGATGMFINHTFVQKHKLETRPLPNPVPVHNVDGTLNENESIMEEVKVILQYGQHMEKAHLMVANLR